MLNEGLVTTLAETLPIGEGVREISICVHSDTPVRSESFSCGSQLNSLTTLFIQGSVEIAQTVKRLVDESNVNSGFA